MKVIIQIPCLDEEATLPLVFATIPTHISGVDTIETLVIDDGSSDRTADVARELGVTHLIRHSRPLGLARSFRDGADFALRHGADILVNTDGDNQYPQERIGDLVEPIIAGRADIVVADRQTATIAHFSPFKRRMQAFGSAVVNRAASTDLPDAASGFRAYSAASLMRLNIVTEFSYCMETIIQAGHKRLAIESIPVVTNAKTRESRLFSSIWQHMAKSASAIIRSFIMFKPHAFFGLVGAVLMVLGLIPFVRFLVLAAMGDSSGHVQSLIFGTALLVGALFSFALLILADLQRTNRVLLEETIEQLRLVRFGPPRIPPVHDDEGR